ncbi:hypothetical protein QAD02_017338 [Eretmocerus hayati]|uniref:Uncharacterized protein n=2 Tax=Eretmocerus hayati TaxID=131215 RepID=A0ACC2PBV3_9HYME|nr:hypothetical protein QAD02_016561 [Eretmocerus hayati]KAJ8681546.1 hypothetical protein QAD02_017338 [Eretmocerus hayati]
MRTVPNLESGDIDGSFPHRTDSDIDNRRENDMDVGNGVKDDENAQYSSSNIEHMNRNGSECDSHVPNHNLEHEDNVEGLDEVSDRDAADEYHRLNRSDSDHDDSDHGDSNHSDSDVSDIGDGNEIFGNERDSFDRVMFVASGLTVGDVIVMIKAFSLEAQLTDDSQAKLGNLLKTCAGPDFEDISLSKYTMAKYVPCRNDQISYHYFCSQCSEQIVLSVSAEEKIKKSNSICPDESCAFANKISIDSQNYFTSINIEYQLMKFFGVEQVLKDFVCNIKSRKDPLQSDCYPIKDVQDGQIHRKIVLKYVNKNFIIATFDLSTDGAPLNRSGKRSMWPQQLFLNDLSPKLRWKYMILSGILVTDAEPSPELLNLFVKVCVLDQLKELNGKTITLEMNGETFTIKFRILNANLDSPCRGILQNRMLHSAYHGCSWCYIYGTWFAELSGVRFPSSQEMTPRTHESHLNDVKKILEILEKNPKFKKLKKKKDVNGVKGSCCFMESEDSEDWDMVWSFSYEYMHGPLLGIMLYIFKQLEDTGCPHHLTPSQFAEVERRFTMIKPCQEIHRLPRKKILTGKAKMKASEAKSWALHYFLPCFDGILEPKVMDHFGLFSKTLYTYLTCENTEQELLECERDSLEFVTGYEEIYGPPTFNVHTWLHAAESVRQSGPLPLNSAFPPESHIYYLKKFVNGPKDPNKQIAKKHLQLQYFKTGCTQHPRLAQSVKNFIDDIFTIGRSVTAVTCKHSEVTYFNFSRVERVPRIGDCNVYSKCIHKGVMYHSDKYLRAQKTDDTVVQLISGEYVRISDILEAPDKCLLRVSLIETCRNFPFRHVSHIRKIVCPKGRTLMVSMEDVLRKILFIDVGIAQYLSTLPNTIELQ